MSVPVKSDDAVWVSIPKDDEDFRARMFLLMAESFRSGGGLCMWTMPSHEDRKAITARIKYLSDHMKHDRATVKLLVQRMLQGFRARYANEPANVDKMAKDVDLFARELAIDPAVPTWTVALACNRARMGKLEGCRLGQEPATSVLRRACDLLAWERRCEIGQLDQVLKARPATLAISETERREVARRFLAMRDDMKARQAAKANDLAFTGSLSDDDLIAAAGGADVWNAIPDRVVDGSAKVLSREANRLVGALHAGRVGHKHSA